MDSGAAQATIYSYRGLSTQASLLRSGASPILEDQEFYDFKRWSYLEASPTRPLLSYQELLRASGPSTTPPSCEASPIQASLIDLLRGDATVTLHLQHGQLQKRHEELFIKEASKELADKNRCHSCKQPRH